MQIEFTILVQVRGQEDLLQILKLLLRKKELDHKGTDCALEIVCLFKLIESKGQLFDLIMT